MQKRVSSVAPLSVAPMSLLAARLKARAITSRHLADYSARKDGSQGLSFLEEGVSSYPPMICFKYHLKIAGFWLKNHHVLGLNTKVVMAVFVFVPDGGT